MYVFVCEHLRISLRVERGSETKKKWRHMSEETQSSLIPSLSPIHSKILPIRANLSGLCRLSARFLPSLLFVLPPSSRKPSKPPHCSSSPKTSFCLRFMFSKSKSVPVMRL
ncbi:hypothetical protein AMECASPLE_020502 [Ameca splendens]|uniref:Uncharacterized protein n=1 Tax=Ameca splendens TaxID=208324 RepID=A0ABV0ZN34_9TELE